MLRGRSKVREILKGGENIMGKSTTQKVKKTSHERFALKVDKIVSTLIQMKPIADSPEKKIFVYSNLKVCLQYAEELANATE